MQAEKECYICGRKSELHKHHIFYGNANRKISEYEGCWMWLCARHHNMSDEGIHFNRKLDIEVKQECQRKWQELHPNESFIELFGKSWL